MNKETIVTKTTSVNKKKSRKNRKNKKARQSSPNAQLSSQKVTTVSTTLTNHKPRITSLKDRCRVVHTEPLGVVSVPNGNDFNIVIDLDVNPGDQKAFPWLSTTAQSWEYYKIHKLKYHYLSRTSTSTNGEVVMAPDYDINDEIPTSIDTLTQNEGAVSSTAFKDFHCNFSSRDIMGNDKRKLVRGFIPRANFDQGRYDVGSFYVAVSGIVPNPATYPVTIGRVYVEYDIEFFVPQGNKPKLAPDSAVLQFSNSPTIASQLLNAGTTTYTRPANTLFNGLQDVLQVDSPSTSNYKVLVDTVLNIAGADQFYNRATGARDVSHIFTKVSGGETGQFGGATSKAATSTNADQDTVSYEFTIPVKAGDIIKSAYVNNGVDVGVGGYSSLSFKDVGRNYIYNH